MHPLLFNIAKIMIASISITHPLDFYFIIINNPPFIVYEHLIGLTTPGQLFK